MQLHHKVRTFESLNKYLVLVVQDSFLHYMQQEFTFNHVKKADVRDTLQFHGYRFEASKAGNRFQLVERLSTDSNGVAKCLGLQTSASVDFQEMISAIEKRMSDDTVINVLQSP